MKKNDGYVLISVVFIILVLCIIAAGICTSALNSLKLQNTATKQLQERCTVESNVEQFMSEVCVNPDNRIMEDISSYEEALDLVKAALEFYVGSAAGKQQQLTYSYSQPWAPVDGRDEFSCILAVSATHESITVTASVEFTAAVAVSDREVTNSEYVEEDGELVLKEVTTTVYDYVISSVTSRYLSYSLDTAGGGA